MLLQLVRQSNLIETTDAGSNASQEAILESYQSMNKGFEEFYGKWLIDYLNKVGLSGTVLDLGCGNGFVANQILQRCPDVVQIIGVDKSEKACQEAKKLQDEYFFVKQVDAHNLSWEFNPGMVDFVVIIDALHHFSNPVQVLAESLYVLRPEGKIIIFEVARNWFAWVLAKFLTGFKIIPSGDFLKSVLRGYTKKELEELFESQNGALAEVEISLVARHFNAAVATKKKKKGEFLNFEDFFFKKTFDRP